LNVDNGTSTVNARPSRIWSGNDQDATIAKVLLKIFEKANEIHVADRDRLIKELAASRID
jgi:hypothetical protein